MSRDHHHTCRSAAKHGLLILALIASTAAFCAPTSAAGEANSFHPGSVQLDTDGKPINAHWTSILLYRGVYYWFGEKMEGKTVDQHVPLTGLACYTSRDLYHWKNEGVVLPAVTNDPSSDLALGKYVERAKVIYNRQTHKFVMWLHVDSKDYKYARAGVAISDRPTGPYKYLGSMRPNGSEVRDMTLFQDDDGKAYLVYASEGNSTMHIDQLTDDYLKPNGASTRVFVDQFREAPAVFRFGGRYFLLNSKCADWRPSAAKYAVAPSMMGPWEEMGNPAIGPDAAITFNSQSTYILPVAGRPGAFIFMADRWNSDNLEDSRYIWLPISVNGDKIEIKWRDQWDLSVFNKEASSGGQ
jgi:hypothetical protein